MKMNKLCHHVLLSCCVCMLVSVGCDDYLDIAPKGKALLTKTEDYLGLLEDVSPTYDHSDGWFLCGDASWYKAEELKNYTYPLRSANFFWDESYDRAAYTLESPLYNDCYGRITKYNVLIDNIGGSEGTDEDKRLGMAQAKIMRAYNYFFLLNTFAPPYDPATVEETDGIIVREKMFETIEDEGVQRSVGYTYRFIQQDIDDALEGLPHVALNSFRPDKTFGLAFKAKVHLYKREYDQCIQACEAALEEAPAGNHELWNMNDEYNKYAYALLSAYGTDMAVDEPQYMGVNDLIETVWKTRVSYGYDGAEQLIYMFCTTYTDPYPMYVRKSVLDLFERDADLRYRFCIRYKANHEAAPDGDQDFATTAIKWNPSGMRLSEVYLMLAECYARKRTAEGIGKAMYYLEILRSHRLVTGRYAHLYTTNPDEALRLVREERKRELFLTYNGFFDMRRFCTEFNETLTQEFEGQTYTLSPKSHLLTFPFPLNAIQNSNLKQNSR